MIITFGPGTIYGSEPALEVDSSKRYLVRKDGINFFWLADTAWKLSEKLSREEVDKYVANRKAKGFTVIQFVAVPFGAHRPNYYGETPFVGTNYFVTPNEAYWKHIDYMVNKIESAGMYVAFWPAWGLNNISIDKYLTIQNAESYGQWVGNRYKNRFFIWVMGGDDDPREQWKTDIYKALAKGVTRGVTGGDNPDNILLSYHPGGAVHLINNWQANEAWIDFMMLQTGHTINAGIYGGVSNYYNTQPTKPVLNDEPGYEDTTDQLNGCDAPRWNAWHVRRNAYWSVFAGGFGHTYGGNGVWNMTKIVTMPSGRGSCPRYTWDVAMDFEGAYDMQYLKNLMLSRPYLGRVPDQSLITSDAGSVDTRIQATIAGDGSYAMIYSTSGGSFSINLNKLSGTNIKGWWFNPREGTATLIGSFSKSASKSFTPPSSGTDWVLVVDNASKNFPTPGIPLPSVSTPPVVLEGDANGDDKVNNLDYAVWLSNYGKTVTGGANQGDFDNTGIVDIQDYIIWLENYSG